MDLPVCFILALVLFVTVKADPTDQGPQTFSNPPTAEKHLEGKIKHKREPKYEEVILYLTPSQIRAYESGKGLLTHQQAVELRATEEGRGLIQPPLLMQHKNQGAGQEVVQPQQTNQFGGFENGSGFSNKNQQSKFPALQALEIRSEEPQQPVQTLQTPTMDLPNINKQLMEMQNSFNDAGQKLQKEVKKFENKKKEQMQLEESKKNKSTKDKSSQQLEPENNVPQFPQFDLQKRGQFIELPLPLHFIPQEWSQVHHSAPVTVPHFGQQLDSLPALPRDEQHLISNADPKLIHFPSRHDKPELSQQNYAYLYFYPHGKSLNHDLPIFFPTPHQQKSQELFIQPQPQLNLHLQPRFQLIPYEYAYQNKLEAHDILQTQLHDHRLDAQQLEAHKLEAHQLEDFDAQQLLIHKQFEPLYQHQYKKNNIDEQKYEPQEINLKIIPHTAALRAQASKEIKVDLRNLNTLHKQEIMEVFEAQKYKSKAEAEEKEAHRLDTQLKEEELKAEKFKAEQINEELFKNQEFRDELLKSITNFENHEYKERFENNKSKESPIKIQEVKKDIFESQPSKDQLYNEYQDLGYLQKLEPKRTQMYSILNPLFQGHSITESLQQQKSTFPHHKIHLETGFKPLQYAPKFSDQKYAREVEKMFKRNSAEKQKALAKAAAIANEPPVVIHSEEKVVMEPIVKHVDVPVPTPVMVPVPTPIEVKVPQPFPVPVEIIRHYPVSIVKTQKVEVKKPVPIEIEKRVPVPITKNIYVKVDKPYFVPKVVPVEVKREIPVQIPVKLKSPLKLSIIKHVWEH